MGAIQLPRWNGGDHITAAQLNRIVDAIRRATPVQGKGVMVSQSAGGSVISLAPQGGAGGAGGGAAATYPFRLSVLKTASHDYIAFEYSDGAVMVGSERAACMNNYSPTTQDGSMRLVADSYTRNQQGVGTVTNAEIDDLEIGESVDVYAVAARMESGYLYYLLVPSAIYTTTAPSEADLTAIPSGDEVVQSVLVGTVKRTGTSSTDGGAVYDVTNQAVRSAITLGNASADGPQPLSLRVDDAGHLDIYLPLGCMKTVGIGGGVATNMTTSMSAVGGGWYRVATGSMPSAGNAAGVYLFINLSSLAFYVAISGGEGVSGYARFSIGYVENTGTSEQPAYEIHQQIYGPQLFTFAGAGGGGGTPVVVQDADSGSAAKIAVAVMVEGTVYITNYPSISDATVAVNNGSLADYLKGGPTGNYGTNINSENFEDECLGDATTPDEAPNPNKAAPSCHTHLIRQITADEDDQEDLDALLEIFSNVGMWDDLEEVAPTGMPDNDSLLAISDVDVDETRLKPDSAVPSAGKEGDGLALLGHQHPLNLVDDIPLPTGETEPVASDYVMPIGVGTGPSGEAAPEVAMFGSDPYYARVDHVHPICAEMGPSGGTGPTAPAMDGHNLPSGITLDTTEWTPGAQGLYRITLSRVIRGPDVGSATTLCYWIFRREKFSRTGALIWRGPEFCGIVTSNPTNVYPSS